MTVTDAELVAAARGFVERNGWSGSTHYVDCWRSHSLCMLAFLAERLEGRSATSHRMLTALSEADSSLTWCKARHDQGGPDNVGVLDEAIIAVLAFTRPRRSEPEGKGLASQYRRAEDRVRSIAAASEPETALD